MYKKFKEDEVTLSGLGFVLQTVTGEHEFTGAIELDFRGGGFRSSVAPQSLFLTCGMGK